jgi:UDP-N-acetylglucosamine 1-carboxyvinyltransferase
MVILVKARGGRRIYNVVPDTERVPPDTPAVRKGMDKFVIRGGNPLLGTVRISGAKNAALPAMAAALLTEEPVILENIPQVRDIETERRLLVEMGAEVELGYGRAQHRTTICARRLSRPEAGYDLVKTMRASTLVLGPLVARMGVARVSLPGGCAIGARPINLHIKGLEKLGATITTEHGYVEARASRLKGAEIAFDRITVTGTEDLMMAAVLAEGETVMENCAREPEVADLAALLTKMGAKIEGAGTSTIRIRGVSQLSGARHRIIPDRIEAGTLMVAAAITNGELTLDNCRIDHLMAFIDRLTAIGVNVEKGEKGVVVSSARRLEPVDVTTQPFPGFPTDLQAQLMALLCLADGNSIVTEKIFPDRFLHVAELSRMGANLRKEGPTVIVQGVKRLVAAPVMASDLRASAALVLAGLAARGTTRVNRIYHLQRGYDRFDEKLRSVGADIQRKEGGEDM